LPPSLLSASESPPVMPSAAFIAWWKRFRETGEISPVRLGISREEMRLLFGDPDDVGGTSRKHRTPAIWKYGKLEFHFGPRSTDVLSLIYCESAEGIVDVSIPRRIGEDFRAD
jgi:hypothetical protein